MVSLYVRVEVEAEDEHQAEKIIRSKTSEEILLEGEEQADLFDVDVVENLNKYGKGFDK